MPKPVTFKQAAVAYRRSARVLLRSSGKGIQARDYQIIAKRHNGKTEVPLNPAEDLRQEANAFLALLSREKISSPFICGFLFAQIKNVSLPIVTGFEDLISGGALGPSFRWPTERHSRILSLVDKLDAIEESSRFWYYSIFSQEKFTLVELENLAKITNPTEATLRTWNYFRQFVKPELYEDALKLNAVFQVSDIIPEGVSYIFPSSLRGSYITVALAFGAAASVGINHCFRPIPLETIKHFAKISTEV